MRIRNTPIPDEEAARLLNAFPSFLSDEEEVQARRFFDPILFYSACPDGSRDCYCSVCGAYFNVRRKGNSGFFRLSHKKKAEKTPCPTCKAEVTLRAMNKFQNFSTVNGTEQVCRLMNFDGWLLLESGFLSRIFETCYDQGQYLTPGHNSIEMRFEFVPFRRYAFRPGFCREWRRGDLSVWGNACPTANAPGKHSYLTKSSYISRYSPEYQSAVGNPVWTVPAALGDAFPCKMYARESSYWVLHPEEIANSDLKYCQYWKWFNDKYGVWLGDQVDPDTMAETEPVLIAWLATYLACYTQKPQIEMAVKFGFCSTVDDLVCHGNGNNVRLNWKATNPADFLRLSKADFKEFRSHNGTAEDLNRYRDLANQKLVCNFAEFWKVKTEAGSDRAFRNLIYCARFLAESGYSAVSLSQCLRYLLKIRWSDAERPFLASHIFPLNDISQLWRDYLNAAEALRYDLSEETVRMPKNLRERHDAAITARQISKSESAMKRYRKHFSELCAQYDFEESGLRIVVPKSDAEIILEGKTLHHCVGGYAARHLNGQVCILFLRQIEALDRSYVTIEMSTEPNPEKKRIVQIYGYRNDREAQELPEKRHAEFLKDFLSWVHSGSPRDHDGKPVVPGKKRIPATATM